MATDVNISSPIPVPISGHVVVDTGSIAIGNSINISNFPTGFDILNLPPVLQVAIENFPVLQQVQISNVPLPISGAVSVLNFPAVLPVTIANFPPIQSVLVSNFPAIQPITGDISITNFPALQPVSVLGGVDILDRTSRSLGHVVVDNFSALDVTDRAARLVGHVAVDSLPSVSISNFPASQPVTGNFFQPVQPVSFAAVARQSVMLSWERLAGTASESVPFNFTNGTLNAANLSAASAYTVSPGKTFRITQINVALRTTANNVVNTRVRIRQAASVTNTSPIIWQTELGTFNTANAAEVEYFQSHSPDGGIEIAAGQQITVTHIESSAVGTVSVVIIGYEY